MHQTSPETAATEAPTGDTTVHDLRTMPQTLYAAQLIAGPAWKLGAPPGEQALGPHFEYVAGLFKRGALVANGIYGDEVRGLYVYAVSDDASARELLSADPAVQSGVLRLDELSPWVILFDGLGAAVPDGSLYFIGDYGPGPALRTDIPAAQQLGPHLEFMAAELAKGHLLAAGPVGGTDHGRYIFAATNRDAVDDLLARDPGIASGVLRATLRPWVPAQRQGVLVALAARDEGAPTQ